jgi:gas vesicle protein
MSKIKRTIQNMKEEINKDMETLKNNQSEINETISQIKFNWKLGKLKFKY